FQASHGVVSVAADGSFVYTPDTGYVGGDNFSYVVSDGVSSDTALVSIDVTNAAPDAVDDDYQTGYGQTLNVAAAGLLANDQDADGDALEVLTLGPAGHGTVTFAADGSFSYTPDAGFHGVDTFQYTVSDGVLTGSANVSITVTQDLLRVASVTPTNTGYELRFNHAFDSTPFNLYDGEGFSLGAADALLKDAANKTVAGSIVVHGDHQGFTFVKTGDPKTNGLLAAGAYTLTLDGRLDGLIDTFGRALDGDGNGVAGGNFATGFTQGALGAVLTVGEIVRGPGQWLNPATLATGLPVRVSNAAGVNRIDFTLEYDAGLLDVSGVTGVLPGATTSADWSVDGRLTVTITGITTLTTGALTEVARIQAQVADAAPYGSREVLNLADVQFNNGAIAAQDDDGLHVVAYAGDATGNGGYTTEDIQKVTNVLARRYAGYGAYPLVDPLLIGNVTGNGTLSSLDLRALTQKVMGIAQTVIPEIPAGIPPLTFAGPDPLVNLPVVEARAGETITVPVQLDTAANLVSVQLALAYSATDLELVDVRLGGLTLDFDWFVKTVQPGRLTVDMSRLTALAGGSGNLLELDFRVAPTASGTLPLDLQWTALNDTRLTLNPEPQPGADPTDGAIRVAVNDAAAAGSTIVGAAAGGSVTVPISLDELGTPAAWALAFNFAAADLELTGVRLGESTLDAAAVIRSVEAGSLVVDPGRLKPGAAGSRVLELDFKVAAAAQGTLEIDVSSAEPAATGDFDPRDPAGGVQAGGNVRGTPSRGAESGRNRAPVVNMTERTAGFGEGAVKGMDWVGDWVQGSQTGASPAKPNGWKLSLPAA
ncbi:MAG: cadherin-like domain-containing protein, partial [Burkholderiales bacterium]|nr:cadherin-like domain-containing protein [Burkholderiales bacterium]